MRDTQKWGTKSLLLAALAVLIGVIFQTATSQAATGVNNQISFQGKVVNSSGTNVPDGTYNLEFKIYQDGTNTGAGSTLKWTEDRLVGAGNGVTVTAGTFQVNLGSVSALTGIDWNQDTLWLSMNVGGTASTAAWDGEMTPYIRFTSVPYALNAGSVNGLTASQLVQLTPSSQQSGNINVSGSVTTGATGTNALAVTGTPAASSTSSLVQIGSALVGGYSGGTYLGMNTVSGFAGTLVNLQVGGVQVLSIGNSGALSTAGNINTNGLYSVSGTGFATFNTTYGSGVLLTNITSYSQIGGNMNVQNSNGAALLNVNSTSNTLSFGTGSTSDTFTKLSDPASLPTATSRSTSFSPDNQYMTVTGDTTPYAAIYKRSGDTFTKLANPAALPTGQGWISAWSPDAQYMTIGHGTSPYLTIYKRSGDTFTKLANPATLPTSAVRGVSFSPDGQYMSVANTSAPYFSVYKRSGDTFTKLADPATLPAGSGTATAWSPDGQYVSVAHNGSPFITIYKRSGDTFTKLADPATLPTGFAGGTAWSPDGQYMSVAHDVSPYVTIYKRSGDTFTKLANPATLPTGYSSSTAFSNDGQYMTVTHDSNPYVTIYKRSGDTFTKLANPSTLPPGIARGTAFSPDSQYMAVGDNSASPWVTIYKIGNGQNLDVTLSGSLNSGNASVASLNVTNSSLLQGNLAVLGTTTLNGSLNAQDINAASTLAVGTLGANNTATLLCRNTANQISTCNSAGAGAPFVQGGQSFGPIDAVLGTSNAQGLNLVTNNTSRLSFDNGGGSTLSTTLIMSGTPPASTTSALLQLGPNTLSGLSAGTYIGANVNSGSTARLIDFQNSGTSYFSVDSVGATNASTYSVGGTLFAAYGSPGVALSNIGGYNQTSGNFTMSGTGTFSTGTGAVNLNGATQIGSATTDSTQVDLQVDSSNVYADSGTCSTTSNQGAMYYNTATNAMRVCTNGAWEDLVATGGLGIMLYGVVPDSGAVPGDLQSTSNAGVSGPCKISWASANSVTVQACTIYTGGRKVVQPQVTITLPAMTSTNLWTHLCFYSGGAAAGPLTNASSWFTTPAASETANLPTFNANNPVACIASIKNNASTANTIAQVYDTRAFTTSQKQFVNTSVAVAPGWVTTITATDTTKVTATAATGARAIAGIVIAGNSAAWASDGPNAIIANNGPVEVKATAGVTTALNYLETTTTAGYAAGTATAPTYGTAPMVIGLSATTFGACATPSAASCQGSIFTNMRPF